MKKIILLFFLFCCIFMTFKISTNFNQNTNLNINLISTANKLYNNKLGPGSYGYFSILIKSNKNINFKLINNSSTIPPNFFVYINNVSVDMSKNNSCLYTGNTNELDKLTFYWEWPINNFGFNNLTNLCMNLQIIFERK